MKKLFTFSILFVFLLLGKDSFSQIESDKFKLYFDGNLGVLAVRVVGPSDVSGVYENPFYLRKEELAIAATEFVHFGASIPLYRTFGWSIGLRLNAGYGIQNSLKNAEGFNTRLISFPQYVCFNKFNYHRNNTSKSLEYSIQLGYKYTISALNHHLLMGAFELKLSKARALKVYGTLWRYKYYISYSDGTLEPAAKIGEYGFSYVIYLVKSKRKAKKRRR